MQLDREQWLAKHFGVEQARLRKVAYRLIGSSTEADDAVQEAWLRLSRSDASSIDNFSGWLTTVVARVCLTCCAPENHAARPLRRYPSGGQAWTR